jgi:hypothetical protein
MNHVSRCGRAVRAVPVCNSARDPTRHSLPGLGTREPRTRSRTSRVAAVRLDVAICGRPPVSRYAGYQPAGPIGCRGSRDRGGHQVSEAARSAADLATEFVDALLDHRGTPTCLLEALLVVPADG